MKISKSPVVFFLKLFLCFKCHGWLCVWNKGVFGDRNSLPCVDINLLTPAFPPTSLLKPPSQSHWRSLGYQIQWTFLCPNCTWLFGSFWHSLSVLKTSLSGYTAFSWISFLLSFAAQQISNVEIFLCLLAFIVADEQLANVCQSFVGSWSFSIGCF